jgi:uncharacterized membrane protein
MLAVAGLWLLFGGSHVGLATHPVRSRLVARFGEMGFTAIFYLVAALSFAWLVSYYAAHRFDGAPGLDLASLPVARGALTIAIVAGFMLIVPALVIYPSLPAALFGQTIRGPRGIERITRHPFDAGTALFAVAHALLAPHAVGIVFFGGFALLAVLGSRHQDGKLLARHGSPYADYLNATSAVPFAAILAGRQRLVWRELPIGSIAGGLALALVLRQWHEAIFAHGGAWIIATFLGGALIAGFNAWRRARRTRGASAPLRWNLGTLLIATAIGHTVVGVALFHDAYAAILRDGLLDAVAPHPDRMIAFWFLLFSPVCFLLGQVVARAIAHEDKALLALLGWYVLGLGVVGAIGLPVSGFWLLIAIGVLMLRASRSAAPLSQYASLAGKAA